MLGGQGAKHRHSSFRQGWFQEPIPRAWPPDIEAKALGGWPARQVQPPDAMFTLPRLSIMSADPCHRRCPPRLLRLAPSVPPHKHENGALRGYWFLTQSFPMDSCHFGKSCPVGFSSPPEATRTQEHWVTTRARNSTHAKPDRASRRTKQYKCAKQKIRHFYCPALGTGTMVDNKSGSFSG